ncbi:PREDICTED: pickpocket protein 28-like [Dinoponera quadriceps]|uniref:Pickpocket protein 28-like n=1 Tax=Dinoponera quadriceps TaxID=609295 RepID=A0A6P3Y3L3_DINQU|nr:PREDICTED: pickpocket protein 28-like [Dinoponera quadriceps]
MEDSISNLEKTKSTFNPWDDARILSHIGTHDLAHLRNFNAAADAMPTRNRKRDTVDVASENYYNTVDRAPFNYPRTNNLVNTVHLQNPYRPPQRLEGYATHDYSKDVYRSQDSSLRWRYNNFTTKKESVANRSSDKEENEKVEQSKKKKHQVCSDLVRFTNEYCTNSTLHGLRYVGDSNLSIVERVFWAISFTSALVTAIYYIVYLYQKWDNAPIIISLSPSPVPLAEFPFPAVTICNMNHAKKTEARRILNGSDLAKKLMLDDICDTETNMTFDKTQDSINWDSMLQFMINVTQPCTDMLYYCMWHGIPMECKNIFNPTMTDEGICCNFNGVNRQFLFYDARDWPALNITYPSPSIDWNAENGYNSSNSVDVIPWRPYGAGKYYGLTLALDVDTDEYYCSNTASAGFKMLLHNPVETPKIADFSFSIMPGKETRVIVKPQISTASKTLISIPKAKRKCFFTAERKLRYYRTYTQRNCVLECEANFTQKMCSCVQYYMPKSSNTQICGKKDEQCAQNARRAMETKLYDEDTANSLNVTESPSCNCWPGCFEINYRAELSQSRLMSITGNPEPHIKNNEKYFTKNMAIIHVFFVDSQFTKYVKTELFGFTEFLSSTGGLLGLFLGFSFLSCMEILYFSTMRLWCRRYRQPAASRPAALQMHPLDHKKRTIYPFAN